MKNRSLNNPDMEVAIRDTNSVGLELTTIGVAPLKRTNNVIPPHGIAAIYIRQFFLNMSHWNLTDMCACALLQVLNQNATTYDIYDFVYWLHILNEFVSTFA